MAKGIAMNRIDYGFIDKDGKNQVRPFMAGDKVEGLPDEVMKQLVDAGAVQLEPGSAKAAG